MWLFKVYLLVDTPRKEYDINKIALKEARGMLYF